MWLYARSLTTISLAVCLMSTSLLLLIPLGVTAEDVELVPTSDVSIGFDTTYPADGIYYTKVDDGASHDSATTYNRAVTNGDTDIYGLEDMSEPSGSYDLDVTIYIVEQDAGTGTAYFDAGVVLSSTQYVGINDQAAQNSWTSHNYAWELNPDTSAEWTYGEINGMNIYVEFYDAAPDTDVTSFYVIVTITYNAEWAPTFTSSPDTTATEDEAYSYVATCNETVTWGAAMTSNATWLTWTQANHTVWGTPDETDIGSYYVNITATSDDGGLEAYQNYTVDVSPAPMTWAPTFTSTPDTTATEDEAYSYEATCNESVTWGAAMTSNATWLTWTQANHTLWGTPDVLDIGSYYVNITATSDAGTLEAYQNYTVTVSGAANAAPTFTSTPDATSHNNTAYYYDANAEDGDEDPLTFDLEGSITAWASITPSTGVVQGTPTEIGDYWMNVSVTDGTATVWQNTSVHIYTDSPSFVTSPITTWQNGTTYTYNAQATDPEAEGLTFHLEGNGTSFVGITPAGYYCELEGAITSMGWWYLNLSVTDGTNTVWQNFTLTALNSAPYFTFEAVLTGMVNVSYVCPVSGNDNNSDDLIYSIDTSSIETLAWLSLNLTSMQLEGVPTINGSYAVNLSVMDSEGLTSWYNFTIEVDRNDADTVSVLALILALSFCSLLLAAGFKERTIWLLAGPCWMLMGILVFLDYGDAFMMMSVGLGFFLFIKGAYDVSR